MIAHGFKTPAVRITAEPPELLLYRYGGKGDGFGEFHIGRFKVMIFYMQYKFINLFFRKRKREEMKNNLYLLAERKTPEFRVYRFLSRTEER